MRKRNERSLVLFALIFVFACLLLTGGSRLIGHEGEDTSPPVRSVSAISAAISAMPASASEAGHAPVRGMDRQSTVRICAEDGVSLRTITISDANGNVLSSGTYMHAVYQAFSLGDGFV